MQEQVFLHYINANVEGKLPHALEFGPIYGRLVTDSDVLGQVVTVVSYGLPRRYFIWSIFHASLRVDEYKGQTVIQGEGWHLCPPREVSEKNINYLVEDKVREHLFIQIVDEQVAKWLLHLANSRKPPGDPTQLMEFLDQMYRDVGNEEIENKIKKALKDIKKRQN